MYSASTYSATTPVRGEEIDIGKYWESISILFTCNVSSMALGTWIKCISLIQANWNQWPHLNPTKRKLLQHSFPLAVQPLWTKSEKIDKICNMTSVSTNSGCSRPVGKVLFQSWRPFTENTAFSPLPFKSGISAPQLNLIALIFHKERDTLNTQSSRVLYRGKKMAHGLYTITKCMRIQIHSY